MSVAASTELPNLPKLDSCPSDDCAKGVQCNELSCGLAGAIELFPFDRLVERPLGAAGSSPPFDH